MMFIDYETEKARIEAIKAASQVRELTFEEKQEYSQYLLFEESKARNTKKEKAKGNGKAGNNKSNKPKTNRPKQAQKENTDILPFSLANLDATSPANEDICLTFLESQRRGEQPICPWCNATKITTFENNKHQFKCRSCKKQFNVKTGTIFENSHVNITKWFKAIFYETTFTGGVTGKELARLIHVSLKTAQRMLRKIREIGFHQSMFSLNGSEITGLDFIFIGGSIRNTHIKDRNKCNNYKHKVPALSMVSENGIALAMVTPDTKQTTVLDLVTKYVQLGTMLYTDGGIEFNKLDPFYCRETVIHKHGQYGKLIMYNNEVRKVSTNRVEGFHSHFKTGLGKFRNSIKRSAQNFLNAGVLRYNLRKKSPETIFLLVLKNIFLHTTCATKVVPLNINHPSQNYLEKVA